jgi:opacity protein-like surface antigen
MKRLIVAVAFLFLAGVAVVHAQGTGLELYLNSGVVFPGSQPQKFVSSWWPGVVGGCGVGYRINSWLTPMIQCDWDSFQCKYSTTNKDYFTASVDLKATLPINSPVRPYLIAGCGWTQLCTYDSTINCTEPTGIAGFGVDIKVIKSLSVFVEGDYVYATVLRATSMCPVKAGICCRI